MVHYKTYHLLFKLKLLAKTLMTLGDFQCRAAAAAKEECMKSQVQSAHFSTKLYLTEWIMFTCINSKLKIERMVYEGIVGVVVAFWTFFRYMREHPLSINPHECCCFLSCCTCEKNRIFYVFSSHCHCHCTVHSAYVAVAMARMLPAAAAAKHPYSSISCSAIHLL